MEEQLRNQQVFAELEDRLARLDPKGVLNLRRDRWVAGIMLAGMGMTLPAIFGAKGEWINWVTIVGMVLELCGSGVFSYRQVRDVAPDFIDAKRKFAFELDTGLREHTENLAWIRSLEPQERSRCRAYVEYRLDAFTSRYQIMFGPVDKLGFLPVLVGSFIQIQAIQKVSSLIGVLGSAIILMYVMAIWLTRFRLQMQRYARLFREAEASDKRDSASADAEAI